jgi:DNA ligase D-like protein (predicted polymerase)
MSPTATGRPARRAAIPLTIPRDRREAIVVVDGRDVRLTNSGKPFWPDDGITKGDLLQYYADVAPVLLPHLRDRAMVMKRYPNGARGKWFFMKRAPTPRPDWIETCPIAHRSGNVIDFPIIQDTASLLWVINLGCIDLNPWYARCDDYDRPDYLHFDLDPVPGATFAKVLDAALLVHEALHALGMPTFVKTTGSTGVHVYVPIVRQPLQKQVWTFAKALAQTLAARHPKLLTAEYRIAKRAGASSTPRRRVEPAQRASWALRPSEGVVTLPLPRTFAPMEALLVDELPTGREWQYEPKWDGFRCLVFRDGDRVDLVSKAGKPLTRYFPDVVEVMREVGARRFVLDGEIVVPVDGTLSFDDLLLRIHPAQSRVDKLARESPASFIAFDLLVDARGRSLVTKTLAERREALEAFAESALRGVRRVYVSPAARSMTAVRRWLESVGDGLDGIIAKRADLPYRSGDRTGMQKVKNMRTAECVVGGFRYASKGKVVGSLLLGLYDGAGLLHHVGFTSNIKASEKPALTRRLEKLVRPPGFTGQAPGGPSRWSTERSTEWKPLKPELVVEVQYDHFSGGRFRHGTSFLRWRPDKSPRKCTIAQVEQEGRSAIRLLRARRR